MTIGLILTRRPTQQVHLHVPGFDEPFVVTLVSCSGQYARLGFLAPPEVKISRPESPMSQSSKCQEAASKCQETVETVETQEQLDG